MWLVKETWSYLRRDFPAATVLRLPWPSERFSIWYYLGRDFLHKLSSQDGN